MRISIALSAAMFVAGAAVAQTAAPVAKRGDVVFDVDQRRLGTISRLGKDGSLQLIVGERIVVIPVDKVVVADKSVSTTLTKAEVERLR